MHDERGAAAVGTASNLNTDVQAFLHAPHVRDRAHDAASCLNLRERPYGLVKSLRIERTKPLINKKRLELLTTCCTAVTNDIGEAKYQ